MAMIINSWPIIILTLAVIVVCFYLFKKFIEQPTSAKIAKVKSWLLYAVTEAEKELGSGTGKIKLSYVYNLFISKFPTIAAVIPFDMFSLLVDDVLEEFSKLLKDNPSLQAYVGIEKEAK